MFTFTILLFEEGPALITSRAVIFNDWYNGNLARFGLLTPEPDYIERPAQMESVKPTDLIARLLRLHERLPAPPSANAVGEKKDAEAWALVAHVWEPCHAYEQALRQMTSPSSVLDDRLRAIYGRLHVQALKIAIILAALDWADEPHGERPVVELAHWYQAQQIAEAWRASAHRLLQDLGNNEENRLEVRVLRLLAEHPQGLTTRSIYRALRSARKPVADALSALEQDGRLMRAATPENGQPGPRPDLYQLLEL